MYSVMYWWILFKRAHPHLLGSNQANCFRDHKELTMDLLGKCPLATSVYLVKFGLLENIVVVVIIIIAVGDSASGNLIPTITRYLLSNTEQQPKPLKITGLLVLLLPLTDVSEQFNKNPGSQSPQTLNAKRDWLVPINSRIIRVGMRVFFGGCLEHVKLAYQNPYISRPILLGLTPSSTLESYHLKVSQGWLFPQTVVVRLCSQHSSRQNSCQ
jgi:hypothetical protein